ncbi:MAG TPA: response regulator, partial [Roseimicrobium sp.]|nr:response regulator [Roseimicrobium sp.]
TAMSETQTGRKRILFVDDEPQFLEMLESLFLLWSKDGWEIHLAHNTGKALAVLQEHPIDLVVLDMSMPVVDGLQFLHLLQRKYPHMPKVALTSSTDPKLREATLAGGAELFLNKPTAVDGFSNIFSTLTELIKLQPQDGFRGVLRRVGLQEVIQLECLGCKSSVLEVSARGLKGRIFIRDGRIVHASVGRRKGEDGFNQLMALEGGEFGLKPFEEPPEETINCSWEMLIMEAARLRDEYSTNLAANPEPEDIVPPNPVQDKQDAEAADNFGVPDTHHSHTTYTSHHRQLLKPRVDEMLVCSSQGDVFYEWQSTESEKRVGFIRLLLEKSATLSTADSMGRLERADVLLSGSRMAIRLQKGAAVLVRTSNITPA